MELLKNNNASLFPPRISQDKQFKNMYGGCGGEPPMDCGQRFANVENRLDCVEQAVDRLEQAVDRLDKKFDLLEAAFNSFKKWLTVAVLTACALVVGILSLYTAWIIYITSVNNDAIQKSLDKLNSQALQIQKLEIKGEQLMQDK